MASQQITKNLTRLPKSIELTLLKIVHNLQEQNISKNHLDLLVY